MGQITQEESKAVFEALAFEWANAHSARSILDAFIRFYRQTRIVGAGIDDGDDQDVFSIECSPQNELVVYRTIHAVDDLPDDSEFDDDGFNLMIEMYFDGLSDAEEDEWLGETEISSPSRLNEILPDLLAAERLAKVLDLKPTRIDCHVGGAG